MMEMTIIKQKNRIVEKEINFSSFSLVKEEEKKEDPVLCNHCLRTASNGIRCMGICVADNDY